MAKTVSALLDKHTLLHLYKSVLLSRLIEEKMIVLLRQGKVKKWFSGIGQEAIAVGVINALKKSEYVLPMHRNLGVFTGRNVDLDQLFQQWQGKPGGFTRARDRSFHFGSRPHKIVGMISHLGPQLGVACGIALSYKLRNKKKVTAVFTGEGGTSEGDFHEALNIASVWRLPVLFCVENNGYALSTPVREQYNCKHLSDRGAGYGMESHRIEGNDVVKVYDAVHQLAKSVREDPRPVFIEFETFRLRGHEEASGTTYVPDSLMKEWKKKDPLERFQQQLLASGILTDSRISKYRDSFQETIDRNWKKAEQAPKAEPDSHVEELQVLAPHQADCVFPEGETEELRMIDAIRQVHFEAMNAHDNLVVMGQDIGEYGGVFKITDGLLREFGAERVRNTPLCESAVVSAAMGLSIGGFKSIVEMQFADFVSSGFNPIVNVLAKSYYRWGQNADVVIRMPCGGGVAAGPFHSQTNEAWFCTTPGLQVVYPAFPFDAKGLLHAAIDNPNPVLFFEHKKIYRSVREEVPAERFCLPIGKGRRVRRGDELSIITYGMGVHWALEVLERRAEISADLIDLRSLRPLDSELVFESVRKTGRVLLITEDSLMCSFISELASLIQEHCFAFLDAPVLRAGSLETPVPFAPELEADYLPAGRIESRLDELLRY